MGRKWIVTAGMGVFVVLFLLAAGTIAAQSPDQNDDEHFVYLPLVAKEYDPTWVWREGITVTVTPSPDDILMAIDRQGQVHLLWHPSYFSPKFIYHTFLSPSGWTSPTIVASSLGSSEVLFPPVVAPNGVLHLLWRNQKTSNDPRRMLYAAFTNTGWTPEEEVFQARSSSSSLQGMVHLDASGTVHATMVDCSILSCNTYHTVRSGNWQPAIQIPQPQYTDWVWPDRWGGVHFYGNDYSTPPKLYYSYWREGQFLTRDRFAGYLKLFGRDTQLDGQNNLHIFWKDWVPIPGGQVTGLYYQCLSQNLTSSLPETLSGYSSVYEVVKGAGYTGWVALAWRESEGGVQRVRVGVWNGCSRMYLKTVPGASGWKELKAVSVSESPPMVCLLGRPSYFSSPLEVVCADIRR
ncbi:MAG: hypothetical protein ACPLYD_16780 [Anaerolineae bacterium]|uniref:hypothetical protein n=1 Tax=Thermogutta sp. TaxID=1962930 RepID=UPI00321FD1B4